MRSERLNPHVYASWGYSQKWRDATEKYYALKNMFEKKVGGISQTV